MINRIKWNDNKVLGNLELNLSKTDGTIYNTIILAGENGTGKTTILETLATFLNIGSFKEFEYINYIIDNIPYTITKIVEEPQTWEMGFHQRKNEKEGIAKQIRSNRFNNPSSINEDYEDIRHYGVVYSKARSGFKTQKVRSTTTLQLDINKYDEDENDDFTSIKQLIIDIDTQDNSEWMKITKSDNPKSFEEFKKESKMYRFENAFNNFFDNLKFKEVDYTDTDEIKVIFEKNGKNISIDELSTGEKQIVFRGAYLLRNVNNLSGGIILIDEPELSMHPKWQKKILQYYRDLFTKSGVQFVQIIIATHSEYVLRSALEDKENVLIITLKDDNGQIKAKEITAPNILPTITAAEINYLVFGIISSDYHIELYGYLQNKYGLDTVKDCDNYILAQPQYNFNLHEKPYSYTNRNNITRNYRTLPTYIRNTIDHPSSTNIYTPEELKCSIELLTDLCR